MSSSDCDTVDLLKIERELAKEATTETKSDKAKQKRRQRVEVQKDITIPIPRRYANPTLHAKIKFNSMNLGQHVKARLIKKVDRNNVYVTVTYKTTELK